ncbi:PLC-like phosphodiesterase [Teratosphaeria nubilosa]|uniref:PLC-like phosphodiesterase n=1 Tax=Teratosphaeria nubilosa TaxID=161662 RepID=A0A6G1LGQ6_9PEZI|nr:PLC-like phosphodiesterase [Teratosphaeria nubilosa]
MRLSTFLLGLSAITACSAQTTCNGQPAYCDRKYSKISQIGTHDSAFVGWLIDPRVNQEESVTAQLNAGIRFLQAQTHKNASGTGLQICHTTCLELDAGSLVNYLSTVKTWLVANEAEVLTLLLTNGDYVNVTLFAEAFEEVGLASYAFVPPTGTTRLAMDSWPTYGEMIADGTRLVMFLDYEADESVVPYVLDEFAYFFETPYDTTDPAFSECTLDRPSGGAAEADGRMYIVNHFLDTDVLDTGILVPDDEADYTTNAATGNGSIGAQADLCLQEWGRWPKFVLVDMFDRGNVFAWQDAVNGVGS